jgi:hypothetical protein
VDRARGARELVGDDDLVGALEDLERVRQIRGARHAGHEALDLRVALQPFARVFVPLRRGPRLIRNLAAGHHTFAGGHTAHGAKRADGWIGQFDRRRAHETRNAASAGGRQQRQGRAGGMRAQIEVGGVERLPDAVEIRLAVRGARGAVLRGRRARLTIASGRRDRDDSHADDAKDSRTHAGRGLWDRTYEAATTALGLPQARNDL